MKQREHSLEQPTPPPPPVSVKGREDGLHVTVADAQAAGIESALANQLERRASKFFAGAAVVLELPAGPLDLALAARLAPVIAEAGMELKSVVSSSTANDRKRAGREPSTKAQASADEPVALVVTGTVRGGQRIAHEGSILIIGDVNPGGEVIGGGSVVVWGRLRGHVEAGLADDAIDAIVCALDLAPTQLRIGKALARAPEESDREPVPEVARESDGMIVVETWR